MDAQGAFLGPLELLSRDKLLTDMRLLCKKPSGGSEGGGHSECTMWRLEGPAIAHFLLSLVGVPKKWET